MKQVLSVEQMKHLKDLGVNTSDASMVFQRGSATRHEWVLHVMGYADVSLREKEFAYTLQDILDKLPCFIGKEVLTIQKLADSYTCLYVELYTRSIIKITESKELIDAAYDMLCWCIENGYVKVGKEEQ